MIKEQIVKLAIGNDLKVEVHDIREYLNEVLDKIRAEIESEGAMFPDGEFFVSIYRINEIIDKYRAESEDKK